MSSRKYAEELVGPLDRSYYTSQRDVISKSNQTNWDNLKNQYANAIEKLKRSNEEANKNYNQGLVNVAEGGYDTARNAENNLSKRGLLSSGLGNLVENENISNKGSNVLGLFRDLAKNVEGTAEGIKSANEGMVSKQNKLSADLASSLGDVGDAETNAQMDYNANLANIAGSKDSRDMNNALAAAQRAASSLANSRNKELDDESKKLDDSYRRTAIASIILGYDPSTGDILGTEDSEGKIVPYTDAQKANMLKINFDVDNADDILNAYNSNIKADSDKIKLGEDITKLKGQLNKDLMTQQAVKDNADVYSGKTYNGMYSKKDTKEGLINNAANSDNQIISTLSKLLFGGRSQEDVDRGLLDAQNRVDTTNRNILDKQNALENLTYEDLANLIYGKR